MAFGSRRWRFHVRRLGEPRVGSSSWVRDISGTTSTTSHSERNGRFERSWLWAGIASYHIDKTYEYAIRVRFLMDPNPHFLTNWRRHGPRVDSADRARDNLAHRRVVQRF